MEPAKIDWKRTESIFVEDELYELINAPKWVDFLAPENSVDVEAWFCRPNCKHPKTAEDFLKSTPSKNRRVAKLKRRGLTQSSNSSNSNPKFNEDSENQNPNMSTPPIHQANSTKAAIKSSIEKKKMTNDMLQNNEVPRLKSTLLARNLFAGQDILNQVTEFCSELKRMATRMREREEVDGLNVEKSEVVVEEKEVKESFCEVLGEVNGRDKERKPLLELRKEESIGKGERSVKEKQRRKKRADEAENVPISLDLDSVWCKRDETLRQIRTNPPSPQCFSATRGWNKTTASKAAKSRLMASGEVLQEMEQNKEVAREESAEKGQSVCIVDAREARTLDVFWFLKPCRLSN
ncbi:uncharacterized protein LOC121238376 isoform X3 [Juglans microcarpa x Juglans regia]|uniref:uncharacterized protein LOC121238376 isoform X3 n=1 Tax=Juglans microcarpa x Juglans regia TaxID=2249226 RepID=UPI001B7E2364|nr:uncharacterized protein LOC121238376 isoform X3 [Juglans microcarpa x Juglans regia]